MALLLGLVAAYAASVLLLWGLQERIAFPAPRAPLPDPHQVLGTGGRIELVMKDGTRLAGWYLPAETPSPPSAALLWFYGNGETIAAIWPVIRDFRPPEAALLVVDYPGYGASGGRTSEAGLYEAGALAYAALASRPEVDRNRIFVYGRSLGSAVATRTAADHPAAGLILDLTWKALRPGGWTLIRQLNSSLDIQALGARLEWQTRAAIALHARDRSFFYRGLHLGRKT